jgi:hypothetical protein
MFPTVCRFCSKGTNVARPLGFEEDAQRADHVQPGRLGYLSRRTIVEDDGIGSYFDGQSDRLPLACAQPSTGHEYGWLAGR